jgi:hypothetical protein
MSNFPNEFTAPSDTAQPGRFNLVGQQRPAEVSEAWEQLQSSIIAHDLAIEMYLEGEGPISAAQEALADIEADERIYRAAWDAWQNFGADEAHAEQDAASRDWEGMKSDLRYGG